MSRSFTQVNIVVVLKFVLLENNQKYKLGHMYTILLLHEVILYRIWFLCSTDRCDLKEKEKVEDYQQTLIRTLEFHSCRPIRDHFVAQLLILMLDMRKPSHIHDKITNRMSKRAHNLPPLLKEIMNKGDEGT